MIFKNPRREALRMKMLSDHENDLNEMLSGGSNSSACPTHQTSTSAYIPRIIAVAASFAVVIVGLIMWIG